MQQKQHTQQRALMAITPMIIPTMLPTVLVPELICLSLLGWPNSQLKESMSLQKASLISSLDALSLSMEDSRLLVRVALGEAEMV